jgi:tRNA nucleotidyltransferase (CCA-adding enzyme)
MTKIDSVPSVLKEVLAGIEPPEEDLKTIDRLLKDFSEIAGKEIRKNKVDAEVFVGGSYVKGTLIKKGDYDIDIFLRFDEKYKGEDVSKITENILGKIGRFSVLHGSRDYFRVRTGKKIIFEIIPTIKVKKPENAENITDLSYFHVNYIKTKVKSQKLLDDIKLAKVFCYANNCYGAESYIGGFSGYALELLIYHYKSFMKFIKELSNAKGKVIIDIEKHYKNKNEVMMNLNSSKLQSPVVLIDPTYRQRNALAALSPDTFENFRKAGRDFLKSPSLKSFELKKADLEKMNKEWNKRGYESIILKARTSRQEGDIAGTKLLKFYRHLGTQISKFFEIAKNEFEYDGKKTARYFFAAESRKERIIHGPSVSDKENARKFKKEHKNTFDKEGKLYAREKIDFSIKDFIEFFKDKYKENIEEMSVDELEII